MPWGPTILGVVDGRLLERREVGIALTVAHRHELGEDPHRDGAAAGRAEACLTDQTARTADYFTFCPGTVCPQIGSIPATKWLYTLEKSSVPLIENMLRSVIHSLASTAVPTTGIPWAARNGAAPNCDGLA